MPPVAFTRSLLFGLADRTYPFTRDNSNPLTILCERLRSINQPFATAHTNYATLISITDDKGDISVPGRLSTATTAVYQPLSRAPRPICLSD